MATFRLSDERDDSGLWQLIWIERGETIGAIRDYQTQYGVA